MAWVLIRGKDEGFEIVWLACFFVSPWKIHCRGNHFQFYLNFLSADILFPRLFHSPSSKPRRYWGGVGGFTDAAFYISLFCPFPISCHPLILLLPPSLPSSLPPFLPLPNAPQQATTTIPENANPSPPRRISDAEQGGNVGNGEMGRG